MIHKYELNGYYIVLDVCSGAVHVVDELCFRMLDYIGPPMEKECPESLVAALDGFSIEEVRESYGELYSLFEAGSLFSEDDYGQFSDRMVSSPVKAMCLHVSHDCNLRCAYCFAGKGNYGGGRVNMPVETGKRAIDYLIRHSGSRRNLELDFFGGEPLLNFTLIREVVAYARRKEKEHNKVFRFTLTTNGLLLDDEKTAFINREMYNVVLSVDGRPEVNDRVRARVDGRGCYDAVVPKFQKLVAGRGDRPYYVRGTFTKYNKDFAEDVFHLYGLGFDQVSVEPVVADPALPYALNEQDIDDVFREYERLAVALLETRRKGGGLNFFHFMVDLEQGPCAIKRLRGCGCGNEYVAVTPDGAVYPCHQFVGMDGWQMGCVEDLSVDSSRKEQFARATVFGKEDCAGCWARFYCSGGCNANNRRYCGDMLKPHRLSCELEKKRLECAIMVQAALVCSEA